MIKAVCFAALILATLAAAMAGLSLGDPHIPPLDVLRALVNLPDTPGPALVIVQDLRLPRVALAAAAGAALALAGTATQTVLRTPLAEPGLLGLQTGAALAAMPVIAQIAPLPETSLPVLGILGALILWLVLLALSDRPAGANLRLLLIGFGLTLLTSAGLALVVALAPPSEGPRAWLWATGSLDDARWVKLRWLAIWGLPAALILCAMPRALDLLALGDRIAGARGQRPQRQRSLTLLSVSMLIGAAVAAVGPIGFVGLIAPYLARQLVGPGHATLLPAATMTGALLLLCADLAARHAPLPLPVGLITALIGAPFFAILLWTKRHDG